jgi:hypothetical protein
MGTGGKRVATFDQISTYGPNAVQVSSRDDFESFRRPSRQEMVGWNLCHL